MAWAKNGTPDTLTSGGLEMSIADLSGLKFNMFLTASYNASASSAGTFNINNITSGTPYAERYSANGGTDGTETSQNKLLYAYNGTGDDNHFQITSGIGLAGEEKLFISFIVTDAGSTGAGTAPSRLEQVAKWADTSNTIDRVDIDSSSGNFDTDSNLSAIGTD